MSTTETETTASASATGSTSSSSDSPSGGDAATTTTTTSSTMTAQDHHHQSVKIGSRKLTIRNEPHHSFSTNNNRENKVHFISTFVAGAGSGALASVLCAPLDLMRTRMQVWGDIKRRVVTPASASASASANASVNVNVNASGRSSISGSSSAAAAASVDGPKAAFKQIIEREGWKGMFRGLGMTLVTVPVFWGIYFPLYDQTKHYMYQKYCPPGSTTAPTVGHHGWIHMSSAVFTGAVADLICNPLFVVRTRLQTQALHQLLEGGGTTTKIHESGIWETTCGLYRTHGLPIFWRGMTANLIGLSHCAVQFPSYEFMKQTFRDSHVDGSPETALELLAASGVAKMCASLISYPHEVLRSRMMDNRSTEAPTLRGTARLIYKREGMKGFYSGLPVTLVRVIPNCCMTFLSYEMILRHSKVWLSPSSSSL
eukprot:CAMPEP_0113474118 /NCGR_PEP_ID=MMETSP0014_2-20120614/18411_1 /TAXON_ID=2857 /ORGANISM="Nitzschia sp." /LENGTH=427 /DNA_ID=CAMNT_0000366939 /DNA_START=33 /DNA_END=1313 /DNA_ORIENTATION=+ /assembly_acc=CAM_ASM_000159